MPDAPIGTLWALAFGYGEMVWQGPWQKYGTLRDCVILAAGANVGYEIPTYLLHSPRIVLTVCIIVVNDLIRNYPSRLLGALCLLDISSSHPPHVLLVGRVVLKFLLIFARMAIPPEHAPPSQGNGSRETGDGMGSHDATS